MRTNIRPTGFFDLLNTSRRDPFIHIQRGTRSPYHTGAQLRDINNLCRWMYYDLFETSILIPHSIGIMIYIPDITDVYTYYYGS